MIGYYIHHRDRGHLNRAITIAAAVDDIVVGISSLPRPPEWIGPWMLLPRDDQGGPELVDVSANHRLHWVPELDAGLTARMADISSWIAAIEPALMVVDVSVEVSLLARLHGIPVVTMVLPGDRGDSAHDLVHSVARRIVAVWPPGLAGMTTGLGAHVERLVCVGGVSRFDGREAPPVVRPADETRRALVLAGPADAPAEAWDVTAAQAQTPGWSWQVMGPDGDQAADPWDALHEADVVITHAGHDAIAEIAAARRPAIVVPQARPFREQETLAAVLAADGGFPVTVCPALPATGWSELLGRTAELDGSRWATWNDGKGAQRVAELIHEELSRAPTGPSGRE